MSKKLLFIFFLVPLTLHARSYDLTLSPCDIRSNCQKCYEVVKLTFTVNMNSRQLFVSGKDIGGKDIKIPIDKCQITDVNNWVCDSSQLNTSASNGEVSIINKADSSLGRANKEVCLKK
jgi:hypothetical protein